MQLYLYNIINMC